MGALATLQATVFDIAHLVGISTPEHLRYQALVVGRLVAWMGVFEPVPVLSKDLLEDIPVPRGLWHHRGAPSWGDDLLTVQRLYHASSASSTPHRPVLGQPSLASFILESRGLPGSGKCKILCYEQKAANKVLSQIRIFIEHAIGGMKRYNILVHTFRNRIAHFEDDVIGVCAGLWNLVLSY
jgi:hypothetical protein